MMINAKMASKAKKRGNPCDRGCRSDALDTQMIAIEPKMKTMMDITALSLSRSATGDQ